MPVLCRLGFHRRRGRSVRPISSGYHGYCRNCGVGMTKPWNKRWRRATENETLERETEEENSVVLKAHDLAEPGIGQEAGSDARGRRRIGRVRTEPPAVRSVNKGMFPKTHRRKLEEADIKRRAIDLAYYLIRDHGDGAEDELAARLRQHDLTSADRRRLKFTETELAERRKRDRSAKAAGPVRDA